MRVYPQNRYVRGTYKRECDQTGFDHLRSEMRKQWDGLIVHKDVWQEEPERNKRRKAPRQRTFRRD